MARMDVLTRGQLNEGSFTAPEIELKNVVDAATGSTRGGFEYYLVRIHSTSAADNLLDALLARPSHDLVSLALISADAFEDGPGLCTVTRREQHLELTSQEHLDAISKVFSVYLSEDSTYYESF